MAGSPNRLRASIVDLTFIIWAIAAPFALSARLFSVDGDFSRHLRMGEFILEGGPWQVDSFAHTFSGPFLTTEWLSQVSYALAYRAGGLPAVGILVGLILGLTYALIVLFMRREAVDPFLAFTTAMVAAIFGALHWVARPHLFTFVGLAVLLNLAASSKRPRLWVFIPFFVIWVNFHGGFVLGLMILTAMAVGDLVEAWLARDADGRRKWLADARFHGLALLIGVVASGANPMGIGLPMRVISILGNDYLLGTTAEFLSPNFHMLYAKMFLVVLLAIFTAFAFRGERPTFPRFAVIMMLFAGSLYAVRNIPLFGVVAVPLVAVEMDGSFRALGLRWLNRVRTVFAEGEKLAVRGLWAPFFAVPLILLALSGGSVAGRQIVHYEFDDRVFPIDAVNAARAANLDGNMFNYFTWGGYIIWAWPEQQIYIDGMTDFLGNDVLISYTKVFYLDPGWEEELSEHDVTLVIYPTDTRVVYALKQDPEWHVWYEDEVATILTLGERPQYTQ